MHVHDVRLPPRSSWELRSAGHEASCGNFLPTFRDNQSVPSSDTKIPNPEDGANRLSQKSVRKYHYSLRNNPEERSAHVKYLLCQTVDCNSAEVFAVLDLRNYETSFLKKNWKYCL